ncbi:MAG: twin-arginine translocase TatA/TatE family subunit [Actinobacteria bacterium]|nr:twin-arginine translocase TatA/TatE family subunit [Actinomycetota bacterium]
MGEIGGPELIIILVIVLVLFGGAKLPQLARSLGEAKREFQRATDHDDEPVTPRARLAAPTADESVPGERTSAEPAPARRPAGETETA